MPLDISGLRATTGNGVASPGLTRAASSVLRGSHTSHDPVCVLTFLEASNDRDDDLTMALASSDLGQDPETFLVVDSTCAAPHDVKVQQS